MYYAVDLKSDFCLYMYFLVAFAYILYRGEYITIINYTRKKMYYMVPFMK
jgi:hypothetical protein